MTTGQTIRKGSQWLLTGSIGNHFLQFGIGIALARLLVPADFGMMVTIQIFTGFVGLIATGGLGQALIRKKEADETDFQVVFTIQLITGLCVYLTFFSIAPWFPDWFDNDLYTDLIRVSALSFILRPFVNIHHSWLHREMRFHERTIVLLISSSITGATSILMALYGFGVWSLVFGGFAGSIFTAFQLFRVTRIQPKLKFSLSRIQNISGYGIKVVANDLMEYFSKNVSNLIITRSAGASMVGLFNKGDSLGVMPASIIGGAVYQPVFREMAKAQDNTDLARYLFSKMATLLVIYTLPLYIGLSWLAEPFILFVYGQQWLQAAAPLQIIAAGGILYCVMHPCGTVLAANNRLGRELVVHGSATLITGLAVYKGIQWGLAGAAFGVLAGRFYTAILLFWLTTKTIRIGVKDLARAFFPGIVLNSVLLLSLYITNRLFTSYIGDEQPGLYMLTCGIAGGLTYSVAFLYFPIQALTTESSRWKNKLGLPGKHP